MDYPWSIYGVSMEYLFRKSVLELRDIKCLKLQVQVLVFMQNRSEIDRCNCLLTSFLVKIYGFSIIFIIAI